MYDRLQPADHREALRPRPGERAGARKGPRRPLRGEAPAAHGPLLRQRSPCDMVCRYDIYGVYEVYLKPICLQYHVLYGEVTAIVTGDMPHISRP